MTRRERDELELGRRVTRYLHIDNELPRGARIVALSYRQEIAAVGTPQWDAECEEFGCCEVGE